MTLDVFPAGLAALLVVGCWGDNSQIGNDEPFRVQGGQFVEGRLIGQASQDGDAPPPMINATGAPRTTPAKAVNSTFFPGQAGIPLTGDATTNTASIGLALEGNGTGYWVVPVGALDPNTSLLSWSVTVDFGRGVKPGLRRLRVVAIDNHGHAGRQASSTVCIKSPIPDNQHACVPTNDVPQAVISLSWDNSADLDLQVIGPDKRLLEPKRPQTLSVDGGMAMPSAAQFDSDANAACGSDARLENLVWASEAPHGRYDLYVNMFDACKLPASRFDLSVYTRTQPTEDGGVGRLKLRKSQAGELLDISANGGSQRGLFVMSFDF